MVAPVVETKLLAPSLRREVVPRPRLADLLVRGAQGPLTLVSAPAGFGKTTLLASWFAAAPSTENDDHAVAWVSLDERDREATTFWSYVLLALDRAVPGSGAAALTLLQSGQTSVEAVLVGLVNELSVRSGEVTLVLDDYHLADGVEVASGMAFLVDHLPPQLHIVVGTRVDPALPLSRLRARGELVEVRANDLRFTPQEVSGYLNELNGLDLSPDDLAVLESRTEGWVAALQLAALSLRNRDDRTGFIAGFAGDDRFVVDYLVEEVLSQQPDDVRRFLLDTSILDRLTGPLCDAVSPQPESAGPRTGVRPGRARLEDLDRANLFLVALDDNRTWYRYHHLFGDVLRSHLIDERPDEVATLHRRAAGWHADAGHVDAAVRHAMAAGDTGQAADLVELSFRALGRERREDLLRQWAHQLTDDTLRNRPVLAVALIGGLMASNEFDGVDGRLDHVEHLLTMPTDEVVVVDRDELPRLPATITMYRAALALVGGDPAGAITLAAQAIAVAEDGDDLAVGSSAALSGLASWSAGDLEAARVSYGTAIGALTRAGHIADVLGCSIALADMELRLGHLRAAEQTFARALALAEENTSGLAVMRGTADMLVGLSRVAWYRNDLVGMAEHLRRSDELGESAALAQNPYRWRVGLARMRAAEGDLSSALKLLDEAERVYVADYAPNVQPIHATRARVLAARGDVAEAHAWAEDHLVSTDDVLSYLREYEHITLARVLLAEHAATGSSAALDEAVRLLDRLLAAAAGGGRTGSVIEVEVLRALAHNAAGARRESLGALQHAVQLARPEGWVRVFVDASPVACDLLRELATEQPRSGYLSELLHATTPVDGAREQTGDGRGARPGLVFGSDRWPVDMLSDREMEVLRLLGSDLDGPAIARGLFVSLNTVRTHTKHIYAKLGVNSRRAAVSKAHQLGLLSGPENR
ncbi:hypothetical protein ASC64_13075 [Nocardioides sp. Root122]|uniref:LuxR C-terminal-related transcriptional regulator n=1 Tax=Nocardioides TaxID=1839 RepID=UPI000703A6C7|nr:MULTISPECIES: LuxR C-terminal-related transcriptional regulator [Nocardioides]KQV65824.1 hypothetical protein ASC64_13075 [Nocardioides sp. Root122]MCK9823254.1 LuxR C-terminal-related transcriptional regulator [Nocardioides cavernae]